ncbi:DUF6492 family protein [Aureimonas sp. AU40]|uniref:DUF6492 family protein n=1 Tax=Aureimonas sp. AU40 TaxID=1637747 RepID=UPI0007866115|nr:DUF6492 family protein [Aureimonas sp. AU40]
MTNPRVAIITPSYRNDFELARALCRSVDEFVRFDHEHILIVPKRDEALFAPLAGPNRRILTPESILHRHGIHRLPLPTRIPLPFGKSRRLREQYYLRGAGRISGWLVQQIVKLSAAEFSKADIFIFADSDVHLFRPFTFDMLRLGDALHLQRHVQGRDLDTHRGWRATAHRLLGVTKPKAEEAFNYIGVLIIWRRPVLEALLARVETVTGQTWQRALTKARTVSEYILYGEFVAEGLAEPSGHAAADRKLYNSVWSPEETVDIEAIVATVEPQHVAMLIQSTNPIPIEKRRAAIAAIKARVPAEASPSTGA